MAMCAIDNDYIAPRCVECCSTFSMKRSACGGDFHASFFDGVDYFDLHLDRTIPMNDTQAREFDAGNCTMERRFRRFHPAFTRTYQDIIKREPFVRDFCTHA